MRGDFERLIHDAERANFSGWDFGFLRDRLIEDPLPWDYVRRVRQQLPAASTMLDLCTGGGERLASLAPLPQCTIATESYPPNAPIASHRLRKLGAVVVQVDEETQNCFGPSGAQDGRHPRRGLPLADSSFDLIICRHGSYSSEEVARLLRPGGTFISQLVGEDNYPDLNSRLAGPRTVWIPPGSPEPPTLEEFGLDVLERREAKPQSIFKDIGAIVYYLKAVPWQIADFGVERYLDRLRHLHEEMRDTGGLRTHYHRHLVVARKR
ncbi:MAG: SAM-dependent methyltransferase [Tepidisphaeraceae bacterium]|jgi:SAM-dependent methyltransferase